MPGQHVGRARALFAVAVGWSALVDSHQTSTGKFDLDVQRSSMLRVRKSHVETTSAFAVLTTLMNGRISALEIHMYAAPVDAPARARLLKNERDDSELLPKGAGYLVFYLDKENHITQANVTVVVPGTTVTRTVAYTSADIAKWFSDYRYDGARLRLNSKGTFSAGADPSDDKLSLSWDVALDVPVVNRIAPRR